MNLIELLNKRSKKEDLTEEELAFLKQYDDSVAVHLAELERLKAEKETLTVKVTAMDTELQDKTRILSEKEITINTLVAENENTSKVLESTKSTVDARAEIERMKAEKEKSDALKKAEAEKAKLKADADKANADMLKELAEMKSKMAISEFKEKVAMEKSKRPYAVKQLDKIIAEASVVGLDRSEIRFEALLDIYSNHEEEMAKYEASQITSTNIFTKTKVEIKEKEEKKDPKYGKLNVDLAKKYGLIGR